MCVIWQLLVTLHFIPDLKSYFAQDDIGPIWTCFWCEPCFCPQQMLISTALQCRHQEWWSNLPFSVIFQTYLQSWRRSLKVTSISFKNHKVDQIPYESAIGKIRKQDIKFSRIFLHRSSQPQRLPSISLCEKQAENFLLLACPVFWPTPQIPSFFSFLGAP